jgi:hypothetical protein
VGSLVLGFWAYDQAAADALHAWELRHPPGLPVWQHALGARALVPAGAGSKLSQASRTLPARLEQEGTAWISEDSTWVAVFGPPDSAQPVHFFCKTCDHAPLAWSPAGRSWPGFERVLARVDALPKISVRKIVAHDPREIRY